MPTFNDSESTGFYPLIPEGDYILTVFSFKSELSTGAKSSGCEKYVVTFLVEGETSPIKDFLLDTPKACWKIDVFLKACGIRSLKKGQKYDFYRDRADDKGVSWINPMGFRCHAAIVHEEYTSSNGPKVANKVGTYYTDRPPLAPDPVLRQKDMEE